MIERIINNKELLVAILGVLSAILVAIIAFFRVSYQINKNSKATLCLKLREEKSDIYNKVYSYIFDLLKDTLDNKELDKDTYTKRYMELKQLLLFNASDKVLKHFIKLNFDTNKNDSAITLDNYFKLLLFIRRELGHKNKGIKEKDILKLFVTSEKDYEELCRKLGYKKTVLYG
ncbi:Uncharacterised protein [uncultured Bacteroides sp.]|uniref:hypothetical protein n=1 Tax=Bacteroides cellulolyticus TaxID=2981780 RepID=UPI0008229965|nr:hypothetical protein [Bacteroides cellulolyticus]MCU6770912.1 hypothetical protein [Bacteroides cellulolyticus]SCH44866.1 Uncharacterised protein [uncultured Bacteroides sp.]